MSETTAPTDVIHRHEVPVTGRVHRLAPGRITHVDQRIIRGREHEAPILEVWLVPPTPPAHLAAISLVPQHRDVMVVATGQPFPAGGVVIDTVLSPERWIGTVHQPRGESVWHLIDLSDVSATAEQHLPPHHPAGKRPGTPEHPGDPP